MYKYLLLFLALSTGNIFANNILERIGNEISLNERNYYGLFKNINNFNKADISVSDTNSSFYNINISLDNGETRSKVLNEETIKNLNIYLNNYEYSIKNKHVFESIKWNLLRTIAFPNIKSNYLLPATIITLDSKEIEAKIVAISDKLLIYSQSEKNNYYWGDISTYKILPYYKIKSFLNQYGQIYGNIENFKEFKELLDFKIINVNNSEYILPPEIQALVHEEEAKLKNPDTKENNNSKYSISQIEFQLNGRLISNPKADFFYQERNQGTNSNEYYKEYDVFTPLDLKIMYNIFKTPSNSANIFAAYDGRDIALGMGYEVNLIKDLPNYHSFSMAFGTRASIQNSTETYSKVSGNSNKYIGDLSLGYILEYNYLINVNPYLNIKYYIYSNFGINSEFGVNFVHLEGFPYSDEMSKGVVQESLIKSEDSYFLSSFYGSLGFFLQFNSLTLYEKETMAIDDKRKFALDLKLNYHSNNKEVSFKFEEVTSSDLYSKIPTFGFTRYQGDYLNESIENKMSVEIKAYPIKANDYNVSVSAALYNDMGYSLHAAGEYKLLNKFKNMNIYAGAGGSLSTLKIDAERSYNIGSTATITDKVSIDDHITNFEFYLKGRYSIAKNYGLELKLSNNYYLTNEFLYRTEILWYSGNKVVKQKKSEYTIDSFLDMKLSFYYNIFDMEIF